MKGLKALAAVLVVTGLLAERGAGHRPRRPPTSTTSAAGSPATPNPPTPARRKQKGRLLQKPQQATVIYTVCVKFPSGKNLCAQAQEAEQGTLYVNKITSTIPGRHVVTWFVKGKKVGSFAFRVT